MKIVVRLSTPQDMPQVLRLIKDLAAFEKEINAVEISETTLIKEGFMIMKLGFIEVLEMLFNRPIMDIVFDAYKTNQVL